MEDAKTHPPLADPVSRPPNASAKFRVIKLAQHFDLSRSPRARRRGQPDAPGFALGDDFLDGAAGAAGEDGIRCLAEPFQFGQGPRFTTAVFWRHLALINAAHGFDPLKRLGMRKF